MTYNIKPLGSDYDASIQHKIDHKTKPLGALGQLESLALKLARIQSHKVNRQVNNLLIVNPSLLVFAADHGIARHGISIAPSEVTQQMVANFAVGGAAVNVFCRQFGWQMKVVDAGMLLPPAAELNVANSRLGDGTHDISQTQAMSLAQVEQGFINAEALVAEQIDTGCNLIAFGEMGIGNTSSAAAIMAAVLNKSATECVGKGTGIDVDTLDKKTSLVQQALTLHQVSLDSPKEILAKLGGFEIVQICGAMLAAAKHGIAVVVDGFICTAAAMVAKLIDPNVVDYLIFAHSSNEQGHKQMLDWFDETPLLTLDMRLGEGSGAALALPIIQAACVFYNEMASFEQAAVDDVVNP